MFTFNFNQLKTSYFHISCKDYFNVSDFFYCALYSLVYPRDKLLTNSFNPCLRPALSRVFRMITRLNSGVLSRNEFLAIHLDIFGIPIETEHFIALTEVIKHYKGLEKAPENLDLEAFIALVELSIKNDENQLAFYFLRRYGYSDNLLLQEDYLKKRTISFPADSIIEFSKKATDFLTKLFSMFSLKARNESNNYLLEEHWNNLFFPAPEFPSFESVLTDYNMEFQIYLADFLYLWNCFLAENEAKTFELMVYLGFDGLTADAFNYRVRESVSKFKPIQTSILKVLVINYNNEINLKRLKLKFWEKKNRLLKFARDGNNLILFELVEMLDLDFFITQNERQFFLKYDLLVVGRSFVREKLFKSAGKVFPFVLVNEGGVEVEI